MYNPFQIPEAIKFDFLWYMVQSNFSIKLADKLFTLVNSIQQIC